MNALPRRAFGDYASFKRLLDILYASSASFLLALPFSLIALSVRISSGSPVIFRQVRVGQDGIPFTCYKIRSMRMDAPSVPASRLTHPDRFVTKIGRFLRRTSLDEITQLYNVLRGDMSLIGPRPLIPDEKDVHRKRRACGAFRAVPGLSGLSQTVSRDFLTDVQKARLDELYSDHASLWLDLSILMHTLPCLRHGEAMRQKGHFYESFILPHRRSAAHSSATRHRHVKGKGKAHP